MEAFAHSAQLTIEGSTELSGRPMAEVELHDKQLLRQISKGDEAAFALVYARHQGQIYRFVLHMTGSNATAEEVTQEVFMLLIRNPNGYDSAKGSFGAYLFGAARNLAWRAIKREVLDVSLDDVLESEPICTDDWDVLEKLSSAERIDLLRKALQTLPELYREVVVLCDLEEMSYGQCASILDCSSGTIASRLHRAHAILKMKLSSMVGASHV